MQPHGCGYIVTSSMPLAFPHPAQLVARSSSHIDNSSFILSPSAITCREEVVFQRNNLGRRSVGGSAMARPCELVLKLALLVASMAASRLALAYDPSPLQDFCVADTASDVFVNGHVCKDPTHVSAADFAFAGLHIPGDTANAFGSKVTLVDARAVPGLNSLGVSMARLDLAPGGLNPPHTHPRAAEVLTVVEGEMRAGFVAADGTLFARVLSAGDAFVFPRGLVHFEFNCGARPAVGIAGLSSQNPGLVRVADSLFGASPAVDDDVLAKAFRIDADTVQWIKAKFAATKK